MEITFTMQICNDPTNGCMYCMCIHMYPSCLNIINQFDGYRTAAVRKPCFVRTKRNLKNPAKRLKLLCLLPFFCWPRKTHTHKAMIISWKTTPIPFECRCICTVIPSFIGIFSLTFIALQHSRCLKTKENISFNIASEASYVYVHFEWPKVYKKCQKWSILAIFLKPETCSKTVLPEGQF